MFFLEQSIDERNRYEVLLQVLWSLSNLFSDSKTPYLYYRWAERAFCKAFNANDYSRWDTAIDAWKNGYWIGLKTYLNWNSSTYQKVAEFNAESVNFRELYGSPVDLAYEISRLRNKRLDLAKNLHWVSELYYHCVTRVPWKFMISEEAMDHINISSISTSSIKLDRNSLKFHDGLHQYNFNLTKSTLLKQFITNVVYDFDIEILDDPFQLLENVFWNTEASNIRNNVFGEYSENNFDSVVLPLYSEIWGRHVPERSGLNLWNAGWRHRNSREVEIRIPAFTRHYNPDFFPNIETPFALQLPNWRILNAKVCQQDGKWLMSNPNKDLWDWLIRDVLRLPEHELVTLSKLEDAWIDSVEVTKIKDSFFKIDFKEVWSYDKFKENIDLDNDTEVE